MGRTTIDIDDEKKEAAKERGTLTDVVNQALNSYLDEAQIHFVNTNARNKPDDGGRIYESGVVATYGSKKYGELLNRLNEGDIILSYVSGSSTDSVGGVRAVGIVQAPWSGDAVNKKNRLYYGSNKEYHVPVVWLAVLPSNLAVSKDEIEQVSGRGIPRRTVETVSSAHHQGVRMLAEVAVGRQQLPNFL